MVDWDDVRRVATALPGVEESTSYGNVAWKVHGKGFLWERPLSRAQRAELGNGAPEGPVLGASVPDEGEKQALIASDPDVFFTISHFDGYPAVLVRLDALSSDDLDELAAEAWLARAPKRLVREFLG